MKFKDERTIVIELTEAEAHDLRIDLECGDDEFSLNQSSKVLLHNLKSLALGKGK